MLAHGFTDRMLLRLVRAGLITMQYEVVKTDDRMIDVRRVTITDAGRRTLKGESAPQAR
jgi:DNA-binding PadR family transcriptional regulator